MLQCYDCYRVTLCPDVFIAGPDKQKSSHRTSGCTKTLILGNEHVVLCIRCVLRRCFEDCDLVDTPWRNWSTENVSLPIATFLPPFQIVACITSTDGVLESGEERWQEEPKSSSAGVPSLRS